MKIKKICVLLLCLTLTFLTAALVACGPTDDGGDKPQPEVTLTGIAITTPPAKTDYYVGDVFDATGMVVTATYSDGTSAAVADYTYAPTGALTAANTKITVTYKAKTAEQSIVVGEKPPAPVTLSKIAVTKRPIKMEYFVGETFIPAGMEVTATYSDGSSAAVTAYNYTPKGALTVNDKKIIVTYKTATAEQAITVREKEPTDPDDPVVTTKIEITTKPAQTAYQVGDTFDPTGMVVTATYSDGTSAAVTDYTFAPDGALTAEDAQILITYQNKTATQSITVTAPPVAQKNVFEAEAAELSFTNNKWNVRWGAFAEDNNPSGTGYLANWKGDGKGNKIVFNITSDADTEAVLGLTMARRVKYDIWIGRENGNKMFSALTLRGENVPLPEDYFPKSPDAPDFTDWLEKDIATVELKTGENVFEFTVDTDEMYWDYITLTTTAKVTWTREAAVGHHYCDWKVTSMPTDVSAGNMYRYCDTCCQKETAELPALSTPDAYTTRSVRDATEFLSGLTEYTFRSADTEYRFTVTAAEATGAAIDNKIEAESALIAGAWDGGKIVRTNSALVGETTLEMLELNNRKGRVTFTCEASQNATVTLLLRLAPHNSIDTKLNNALRLTVNDKLIGLDDLTLTHSSTDNWYQFDDFTVATFDVREGENTLVFDALGNYSYNFDYMILRSAAAIA